MKSRTRQFAAVSLLCLSFISIPAPRSADAQRRAGTPKKGARAAVLVNSSRARAAAPARQSPAREEAYRANNLGVALLEQFRHRDGVEAFRRALRLDPALALARINLAVALFNVPELEEARREADAAAALAPTAPQPHYLLGLIARTQNRADDALRHFRRVLEIDPRDVGALVNTGQLLAQQRKHDEAAEAFRLALAEEPYNGTALYNLGTTLIRAGRREEGQRHVERFQALRQSGAATVTGQNYLEQGRYAEAVASTGAEPDLVDPATPRVSFTDASDTVLRTPPRRSLRRGANESSGGSGARRDDAEWPSRETWWTHLSSASGGGVTLFDYDGDGRLDLLDLSPQGRRLLRNEGGQFADATRGAGDLRERAAGVDRGAVAGDYDNDGRADLFILHSSRSVLLRNEGGGRFSDRTRESGVGVVSAAGDIAASAAFADVDHDGDLDLFVAGYVGGGRPSGEPLPERARRAAPPPLDSFAAAPNRRLRNNGTGTVTVISSASGVAGGEHSAAAVVPADYDNRRDVDLLVAHAGARPSLYRNLRDGTFRDVSTEVGLDAGVAGTHTSVAAGDVNKDGFTDFYFAAADSPGAFALSDGRGRFRTEPGPPLPPTAGATSRGRGAAQFLDYDGDGLLDLLALEATPRGGALRVWRNVGGGAWADVSEAAAGRLGAGLADAGERLSMLVLASADVDADGDTDLFVRTESGEARCLRNDGGSRAGAVRVRLSGRVSNRSGVGAKVEMRAGSLSQKLETYSATPAPAPADVTFGLGGRARADAVRVLWPAGIVQAETEIPSARAGGRGARRAGALASVSVTELDRKPSSCPYLYTWNGERFEFVTDFLGGGELGYWVAPGVRAAPDTDEYVRVRGDQLRPRGGRYEIRVTNELEEALFLDRLRLVAVDHPAGVEVYPNEGLGRPDGAALKIYATSAARPPAAARDQRGRDVLARVARIDRTYADDFPLHRIRGYAEEHALTIDLGNTVGSRQEAVGSKNTTTVSTADCLLHPADCSSSSLIPHPRTLLLMTGWTDYAFSSDNVAAAQAGMALRPPALQVRDEGGRWKTIVENIGVPVGRPQTVVVDLTGKLPAGAREVRVVTNMRVYWDQILLDTRGGEFPLRTTTLEPASAELRWRGFSAEQTPDGREPFGYDYARVSHTSPWKVMPGRYTREGDVHALVTGVDDMFVVARPGDEAAVSFDAAALPPLRRGWVRTFLLYADGFSKEMDLNSASPDQVAPLPFHGMKNYPYGPDETYPDTPAHRDYVTRYNTRVVAAPLARVETMWIR